MCPGATHILQCVTAAEAWLANYVMKEMRKLITMNSTHLGSKTDPAASTVAYFCQKLGLSGLESLEISLAQELERAFSSVSGCDIERCVISVLKSDLLEVRTSACDNMNADHLFFTFKHVCFHMKFFHNLYVQNSLAPDADSRTCVIAVCSSHPSRDLLDRISYARNAAAKILGRALPDSGTANESDIVPPSYVRTRVLPEGSILTCYIQCFIIGMVFLKVLEMGKQISRRI